MLDWFKKLKGLLLDGWEDVSSSFLSAKPDTEVYLLYVIVMCAPELDFVFLSSLDN